VSNFLIENPRKFEEFKKLFNFFKFKGSGKRELKIFQFLDSYNICFWNWKFPYRNRSSSFSQNGPSFPEGRMRGHFLWATPKKGRAKRMSPCVVHWSEANGIENS
jgi:hypothetical protein